jgi:small acid-soluble spore protein H (minor)
MKLSRAQEIVESKQKIEVKYQGNPIWIDRIDEMNETVTMHLESDPERSQEVPVGQITE